MNRDFPRDRLQYLPSSKQGLGIQDIAAQRARFGSNLIVEAPKATWRTLVLATVKDPMLWFLLTTSILFILVGEYGDALILLLALLPFFGMDAFLHRRTQASTASLSGQLASHASVLRNRQIIRVPATELVVGDLMLIGPDELLAADGVFCDAQDLQVDESALTGEAYPVRKCAVASWPPSVTGSSIMEPHWGFAGTRVLTGHGQVRVLYTGGETLYGDIVRTASQGTQERTPLQQAVSALVVKLVVGAAAFCLLLAWVRYQQGHGMVDAIISALTLAVAALPEEFPVALTFFLGVGVYRLAKRQALVRRAVVVENIGRVSCICSDKTGTLTEGRLHLQEIIPNKDVSQPRLLSLAARACRAESGDPLDRAILDAAPRSDAQVPFHSFPFTEDRKRETNLYRDESSLYAVVKGAPEMVLALCQKDAFDAKPWMERTHQIAQEGLKVIACAWRRLDEQPQEEPTENFLLAGLLAFGDPVREGVTEAIENCQRANIHVLMVTGDHPVTAQAIARQIGLGTGQPSVMTAEELSRRVQQEGQAFLRNLDVVARALPAQKLMLVKALRAQGEIVAVTGDGVNDVPALQAADVGIAMGQRGTRSAREIASIVLMNDNFRTIVNAIAEGRQLFANLQLSFQYLLLIHLPLVLTAALIPLLGYPTLYLPIHIVWLEMVIHPSALLVFQQLPAKPNVLEPRRRERTVRFFQSRDWWQIILVGGLATAAILGSYIYSLGGEAHADEHARTMALVVLNLFSAVITASLSRLQSTTAKAVVVATLGLCVVLTQVPALAAALHLQPLHWDDWALALGSVLLLTAPFWLRNIKPWRGHNAGLRSDPQKCKTSRRSP